METSEFPQRATLENLAQLLSRRLRCILLDQLGAFRGADASVAEKSLSSLFAFAAECVRESLIENADILTLFEDLYECCPEEHLTKLFPLFERAIHGSKADGSDKIQLKEHQTHSCTKICRLIMTKLTVTHDLQLRGALLRFVARTLPLTHPSGKQHNNQPQSQAGGRAR